MKQIDLQSDRELQALLEYVTTSVNKCVVNIEKKLKKLYKTIIIVSNAWECGGEDTFIEFEPFFGTTVRT